MRFLRPVHGTPREVVAALDAWLNEPSEPEPIIIETSGSTGVPKRVLLSRRAILTSATATAVRLGGTGQWLLTLPPSYVAGVQVIARSILAGHEPVLLDEHASLADAVAAMDADESYTSLVPTQLRRYLDSSQDTKALREFDTILLGGGPIDPALREEAEDQGLTVVATYGSSETAGGCVYDGLPLDGVSLDIEPGGRIRIAGPILFEGYDGDPALTRQVLRDGWFLTSDLGRLVPGGRLEVLGRVDEVVISGGVNVPTPAVAARLLEHPDVRAVEVLGMPDPEWGDKVVAFVLGSLALGEARDWVADVHPRAWAPLELFTLIEMPLLDNGKVDRRRLQRAANSFGAEN